LDLDFLKGFLVVSMVVYHSLGYFSSAGYDAMKYVRYVTGGFIFASGYVVSAFYETKLRIDRNKVFRRLLIRGLKLLLIFTVLNVTLNFLGIESHKRIQYDIWEFLSSIGSTYLYGASRYSVFPILLPIAYLLLLSPLLLLLNRIARVLLPLALLLVYYTLDFSSFNLYGLIIGMIGVSAGVASRERRFAVRNPLLGGVLLACAIIFVEYFDRNIVSYTAGVVIILKLVYDLSAALRLPKWLKEPVVVLGQHSLFCYLAHIPFLQVLSRCCSHHRYGFGFEVPTIVFVTLLLLLVLCVAIGFLSTKSVLVKTSYNWIFS
jgi:peptidoglycan/LPS O-acetylase OafA/YrhL